MKSNIKKLQKFMKKHTLICRDVSHWAIFLTASFAVATSIADVSAKETMKIIMKNPEIAEHSMLVKNGYLPSFK